MRKTFTVENPMAPLWLAFPEYHRYSLGWRMGGGESYKDQFWNWYSALSAKEQSDYRAMFPEPKMWRGIYNDEEYESADPYCIEFWSDDGKPAYGLSELQQDYQQQSLDFLFFWGHQAAADGKITKSCFSQWWQSDFSIDVRTYCCMEQYMMSGKALLFEDESADQQIMNSRDPKQIKAYGRKVKNFDETLWNRYKYTIVLEGNFYKFSQNRRLFDFLLNTKNRILVEASPLDRIWGIGLGENSPVATNPFSWRGENLLGFALMEVRDELKRVYRYYDQINWTDLKSIYQ